MGLWLLEVTAGSIGFLWPNLQNQFGGEIPVGTLDDLKAANSALPIAEGFPAYVSAAKLRNARGPEPAAVHPRRGRTGDGTT